MRRVIRRALGVGVGVLAMLLAPGVATAAAPPGPRLALVKLSRSGLVLLNVGPRGGDPLRLAGGRGLRQKPIPEFFSPVSWSPDGEAVAFSGIVGFRNDDDHEPIRRVFLVGPDGGGLRSVKGTNGAQGPIVSPDGRTIAFTRRVEREIPTRIGGKLRKHGFSGSSIWLVDVPTGAQRQLTPWREELRYTASSFSPDGSTLLATYEDPMFLAEPQPVALALDGRLLRRIADDGAGPVYSPDGTKIALVRNVERFGEGEQAEDDTDLFVVDADGSGLRRLTRTPGRYEFFPGWDPSGERLAYVRFSNNGSDASALGVGDALMQVNADGTCATKLFSSPKAAIYTPAWQPGAGREAGRIAC